MINPLKDMHIKQNKLQKVVRDNHLQSWFYQQERFVGARLYDICSNLISEISELQNETSWKYWKTPKEIDKKKVAEEIADIDHFVTQLCLEMGIDAEERYKNYLEKNKVNLKRQQEKY